MNDSNNIEIIRDNLKELDQKIENLDVEIPDHTSGDSGKYLGVTSDGSLAFSKVPDELPATTGATAGQILTLDSNKDPEWADNYNLDFSETETNTGRKWIDGKDIYSIVVNGQYPEITAASNQIIGNLIFDTILSADLFHILSNMTYHANNIVSFNKSNNNITVSNVATQYSECYYTLIVYYTKPAPETLTSPSPDSRSIEEEPEPETEVTRTKKSTK